MRAQIVVQAHNVTQSLLEVYMYLYMRSATQHAMLSPDHHGSVDNGPPMGDVRRYSTRLYLTVAADNDTLYMSTHVVPQLQCCLDSVTRVAADHRTSCGGSEAAQGIHDATWSHSADALMIPGKSSLIAALCETDILLQAHLYGTRASNALLM